MCVSPFLPFSIPFIHFIVDCVQIMLNMKGPHFSSLYQVTHIFYHKPELVSPISLRLHLHMYLLLVIIHAWKLRWCFDNVSSSLILIVTLRWRKSFGVLLQNSAGLIFYLNNLGIKELKKVGGWGQVFHPEPDTPVTIFLGGFRPSLELCFGTLPIADKTKNLDEEKVMNGKSRGIYLATYLVSVVDVNQEKIKTRED